MGIDPSASAPHSRTTFTCSMPSAAVLAAQRLRLTQATFCIDPKLLRSERLVNLVQP